MYQVEGGAHPVGQEIGVEEPGPVRDAEIDEREIGWQSLQQAGHPGAGNMARDDQEDDVPAPPVQSHPQGEGEALGIRVEIFLRSAPDA